jgi:hypothetical protein
MERAKIVIPEQALADYCKLNRIRSLALFGSVLRDDFRSASDIDLLVDFEPDAEIGFLTLARIQRELSGILHRRVDLVLRNGLKPTIRDEVLSSAEVVYAA